MPSADELERARAEVRKVYPACQKKLSGEAAAKEAKRLLWDAVETGGMPAIRYAMMEFALGFAADAGNPELVALVIDQVDDLYPVDRLGLAVAHVARATGGAKEVEVQRGGVRQLVRIGQAAIESGRSEVEEAAFEAAGETAKRMKDGYLRSVVETVRGALAALKADGSDAEAHRQAGLYFCVVERDWELGLGHLVKCAEKGLAELAGKDVDGPSDAAAMAGVGDGWWELREGCEDGTAERDAWEERAVYWYEQALPGLKGFPESRVKARLDEVQAVPHEGASKPESGSGARHADEQLKSWVVGAKVQGTRGADVHVGIEGQVVRSDRERLEVEVTETWTKNGRTRRPRAIWVFERVGVDARTGAVTLRFTERNMVRGQSNTSKHDGDLVLRGTVLSGDYSYDWREQSGKMHRADRRWPFELRIVEQPRTPTIPRYVDVNIGALRKHRPTFVGDEIKKELDAIVAAARQGNLEHFRQAVDRAIEATRASERKGEPPGYPNCREDIILVLETIRSGEWDLRSLRIHERDHRRKKWLTGLPGLEYK